MAASSGKASSGKPKAARNPYPKPPPSKMYRQRPGGQPIGKRQAVSGGGQVVTEPADRQRRVRAQPSVITERRSYSGKHMLTAELLIGVGIVALRAVADYEPQADGTMKGKIGHPTGQYGPLPILAGLIVSFFLLSFLAASGGLKAKLAVIAGGIIDLALLLKSTAELQTVADTFTSFGIARVPQGDWQTGEGEAGAPISGGTPTTVPTKPLPPGVARRLSQGFGSLGSEEVDPQPMGM